MPDIPLHTDSNNRHCTFIIVVAWFFTLLGACEALQTLGRLIVSYWTLTYSSLGGLYALAQAVELLFSVAAAVIGLGMLNQRATALRNGVVLLWLYLFWTVGAIAWGVVEFARQAKQMAAMTSTASDMAEEAFQSGLAYLIYANVTAIVTCVVCVWLAQRLSRPIIKTAYAA